MIDCEDSNCNACSGAGTGVCSACEANYYLNSKTCTLCGDGKYSLAGATSSSQCLACADENCNACNGAGINQCSVCVANTYLDSTTSTCTDCGDGKYSVAGSTSSSQCLGNFLMGI